MRVLWLSPWMRPLARLHGEALRGNGDQVLLVTSAQHPQELVAAPWEMVLDPRPKQPASWPEFAGAAKRIKDFDADIVVTELVRDPRWMLFGRGVPRINVVHDDQPHDSGEAMPGWHGRLFRRWHRQATATLCFSHHVAQALPATTPAPMVVPLTSDIADEIIGDVAQADQRRDFVMIGRLNGYKNLPVVLEAWQRHVDSSSYRGDRLRLYGSGDAVPELPPSVWWNGGPYDQSEIVAVLGRAKGSLAHYRVATQSGVQVLSMQAAVAPIVSDRGGLPEFQPSGVPPVGVDDVAGLAATFDRLADPEVAFEQGVAAQERYRQAHALDRVGTALRDVCAVVAASHPA